MTPQIDALTMAINGLDQHARQAAKIVGEMAASRTLAADELRNVATILEEIDALRAALSAAVKQHAGMGDLRA
jgi:GTP-sensing pleiotropic transcriptional regulator CodY